MKTCKKLIQPPFSRELIPLSTGAPAPRKGEGVRPLCCRRSPSRPAGGLRPTYPGQRPREANFLLERNRRREGRWRGGTQNFCETASRVRHTFSPARSGGPVARYPLPTRIEAGAVGTHWLVGGALSGMATSSSSYSGPSSESPSSTVPNPPANAGGGGSGGKPGSAAPAAAGRAGPAPSSSSPRTEHKSGPPGGPPPTKKGPCGSGARPRHKAGQCPSSPAAAAPAVPATTPEPPSSPVASAAIMLSLTGSFTPGRRRQRDSGPLPPLRPPPPPTRQAVDRDAAETSRQRRAGNNARLGGGWTAPQGPARLPRPAAASARGRPREAPPARGAPRLRGTSAPARAARPGRAVRVCRRWWRRLCGPGRQVSFRCRRAGNVRE